MAIWPWDIRSGPPGCNEASPRRPRVSDPDADPPKQDVSGSIEPSKAIFPDIRASCMVVVNNPPDLVGHKTDWLLWKTPTHPSQYSHPPGVDGLRLVIDVSLLHVSCALISS